MPSERTFRRHNHRDTSLRSRLQVVPRGPGAYGARRVAQPGAFPPCTQASPSAPAARLKGLRPIPPRAVSAAPSWLRTRPPSGRPALRFGIGARPRARPLFEAGLRAPYPRPSLNCTASPYVVLVYRDEGRGVGIHFVINAVKGLL